MVATSIHSELVHLLVCPACRGELVCITLPAKSEAAEYLLCAPCALAYPVRDGIPVMLAEEAISTVQMVVTAVAK